jgi:superfamily II DNA or RNA helicase
MSQHPDWSYQDVAVRQCRAALRAKPNARVGLVVPTGGGKTQIALRVALEELATATPSARVLWLTHRRRLKTQAHRALQRLINQGVRDLPHESPQYLAGRIDIAMIGDLGARLAIDEATTLIVVDEAHHAAAPSYAALFSGASRRILFLTATPVRTDLKPIGIETVGYTTTYRDLFSRGVLVEPEFVAPITVNWRNSASVRALAHVLLGHAQEDFVKTLAIVPTVDKVQRLHAELLTCRTELQSHPLDSDDILYVHASQSSTGSNSEEFLDDFVVRPRGILVATTGLLAEGYDDPSINAVVVAYPTSSIIQLMQAGGRALRQAPGKKRAFILQVRESDLAYRFEQRWLYQDISDSLHPQLTDATYRSYDGPRAAIIRTLEALHVSPLSIAVASKDASAFAEDVTPSVLLCGKPYSGSPDKFNETAEWDLVLAYGEEGELFRKVFNDFCARETHVQDIEGFLAQYLDRSLAAPGQWRRFLNMLNAMQYARRELDETPYHDADKRPYRAEKGTTWLNYVSFRPVGDLSPELDAFLEECRHREEVQAAYLASPHSWSAIVRLELPLGGWLAYLLSEEQISELQSTRDRLRKRLDEVSYAAQFGSLGEFRASSGPTLLPAAINDRIERLLTDEALMLRFLRVHGEVPGSTN